MAGLRPANWPLWVESTHAGHAPEDVRFYPETDIASLAPHWRICVAESKSQLCWRVNRAPRK